MAHNEDTRVKIPALLHFTRIGYKYFSLKDSNYSIDGETNILENIFQKQFLKINDMSESSGEDMDVFEKEFQNLSLELGQDDLGKQFYNRLIGKGNSTYKLIDWSNFNNNTFHVCTELACKNGEDNFRPDITIFVNGLPLSFMEVKKPNNSEGIRAEKNRMDERFRNNAFRKFINVTQLLVFSNNMEYDDTGMDQLQGAFYGSTSRNNDVKFNNFREELKSELIDEIQEADEVIEDYILKDTNYSTLKYSPELKTNKDISKPTNRIISSLFTKERLKMILLYGITYVEDINKNDELVIEKHIMRYPQFFATKAIEKHIEQSGKRGIIWHTQGSGKTALAFYNIRYLTDYFSKKGIVPKFYFVVDRIDLSNQTQKEFKIRGVEVNTINSREELIKDFKNNTSQAGITVMNIQKFSEDTTVLNDSGYDIKVQRVYFIDEAHRSYDPKGSFLANLYNADKSAIKIALTGTPLIVYNKHEKDENDEQELSDKTDVKTTTNIFGNYIHKYYYNSSIKDGYTLRLLREEIEASYKERMQEVKRELSEFIKSGSLKKKDLYAHPKFVAPMLEFVLKDFSSSRVRFGDHSIGGMVVCDSSLQARELFIQFNKAKAEHGLSSALILHDEDDKKTRKDKIQDFKDGKIDMLFVYNMLLTGFDAPRLKKLYLGRKIKAHNLLQTLTRVNRPYKDFRVGYVVDFADISEEFDITNKAYFEELNREYDTNSTGEDGADIFGSLFMSKEEIEDSLRDISVVLSDYSIDNLELFSSQITEITDKKAILELKRSLEEARNLYNISRLIGHTEVLEKLDVKHLTKLLNQVSERLNLLNLQEAIGDVDSKQLLNVAIENVIFDFSKVGEEELKMLANDVQDIVHKTRTQLQNNWNQKDDEWKGLMEEFRRLLTKHHIDEFDSELEKMKFQNNEFKSIYNRIRELNRKNEILEQKFQGDRKYARTFKAIESSGKVSSNLSLYNIMQGAKEKIDFAILQREGILQNKGYFSNEVGTMIHNSMKESSLDSDNIPFEILNKLCELTEKEYLSEYTS